MNRSTILSVDLIELLFSFVKKSTLKEKKKMKIIVNKNSFAIESKKLTPRIKYSNVTLIVFHA